MRWLNAPTFCLALLSAGTLCAAVWWFFAAENEPAPTHNTPAQLATLSADELSPKIDQRRANENAVAFRSHHQGATQLFVQIDNTIQHITHPLLQRGAIEDYALAADGEHLGILLSETGKRVTNLYVLDLLNPNAPERLINKPLLLGGEVIQFAFSPDGRSVVYIANEDDFANMNLYALHLDVTGSRVQLNPPMPRWASVGEFAVSPDNRHVAFRAMFEEPSVWQLYLGDLRQPGVVVKLNPPLIDGGDVVDFRFRSADQLDYRADQTVVEHYDWFTVTTFPPYIVQPQNQDSTATLKASE